ncbi:MAG: formate dehydrogenase accessory sulfurtransferase FdhD [Vicinamibacterales bacterium]
MSGAIAQVQVRRVRHGAAASETDADRVAVEAPLEVRIGGVPFATIMRTPGLDRELVAGFLLAERILLDPDDLGTVMHCTDAAAPYSENVITVGLSGRSAEKAEQALAGRRAVVASSACGVCGRRTIDDLASGWPRVDPVAPIAAHIVADLPARLRARQAVFDQTGGLHAAGLFALDGTALAFAEDVGRHNAVDKVVGRQVLQDGIPARATILCVSGRTSFEIVQKAWAAGIPCIAAVSAPSSLAIDVAEAGGITLIGFVRDAGFNVYTGSVVTGAALAR